MKPIAMKLLNLLYAGGLLLLVTACEKDLPVFSDGECMLNFNYGDNLTTAGVRPGMGVGSYSFKLNAQEGQMRDTVWLKVNTMGKLSKESRPIALVQMEDTTQGVINAVAGKHYVAFDEPGLAALYQVPGKSAVAEVPVVVLRDASLQQGNVVLKITFGDNGYFKAGYPEFATYQLIISDRLSSAGWDKYMLDQYFGAYGPQKHELMIKWTGKTWDDEYIASLFYEYFPGLYAPKDNAYITYLGKWFAERLAEENAVRLSNPEIGEIWKEKPEDGGGVVDFTPIDPYGY